MSEEIKGSGISEIISTILMLGIAIALFSVVSMFILSYPFSTPSPQVNIVCFIDETDIIWEHHGGPSLDLDTNLSISINGSDSSIIVGNYLENDLNGNNKWDIGERVIYPAGDMSGLQVDVIIIDLDSNSIVMMGTLQEGITEGGGTEPTPPSLNTSVDEISPYEQSGSPLTITATGDSNLDNVSLYYRWSDNNWSNSWTTLTFDDFEDGFGNYTDGGWDCYMYSGGTYAHQGSNAASIQDNSGDSSSFYHTSGIDVDNPTYTSIKVEFWFYAVGMGSGHDFWVQYFDGGSWNTIADYDQGDEFVNGQFYHETIWINESEYNFPSNMQIKFICDAHNNNNDVYIDEIYVNATFGNTLTIFQTSFEDSSELSNWTLDPTRTTAGSGYILELDNDGTIGSRTGLNYLAGTGNFDPLYAAYNITIDITNYTNVSVSVWYSFEDTETDDEFGFYYWNGLDWVEIFEDLTPQTYYPTYQEPWTNALVDIPNSIDILVLQFWWSTSSTAEHLMIEDIAITGEQPSSSNWQLWTDASNPDTSSPWTWDFNFPNSSGYYEFYSIGKYGGNGENAPSDADTGCYYNP